MQQQQPAGAVAKSAFAAPAQLDMAALALRIRAEPLDPRPDLDAAEPAAHASEEGAPAGRAMRMKGGGGSRAGRTASAAGSKSSSSVEGCGTPPLGREGQAPKRQGSSDSSSGAEGGMDESSRSGSGAESSSAAEAAAEDQKEEEEEEDAAQELAGKDGNCRVGASAVMHEELSCM